MDGVKRANCRGLDRNGCRRRQSGGPKDLPHQRISMKNTPRRGFTLIELLVVTGVISILAALVLPAIGRAKATARRVECIARLKQWTQGFLTYKDDNEERIPREGYHLDGRVYWNNWAHVEDDQSKDVWYNALDHYVGVRSAASYVLPQERLSFYHRLSFFHCPGARFPEGASTPLYQ